MKIITKTAQAISISLQKLHVRYVELLTCAPIAIPLTVVCFLALFLGMDPLASLLDPQQATPTKAIVAVTLLLGYTAYAMLEGGSDQASFSAEQIAKNLGLPLAVMMGILAFGTSLSEGGSVLVGVQKGDTQFIYQAIVGSDFFQAAFLMPLCILVCNRRAWRAERLRIDMILTSCMTGTIAIVPYVGLLGTTLAGMGLLFAILAFIQFNIDTPSDAIEQQDENPTIDEQGINTLQALYKLVFPGFGVLLLGSNYMYVAVNYLVNVLQWPDFLKGFFVAVSSSAGEMFTTLPQVSAGNMPLSMATIALLGSNVCDTTFMLLGALYLSIVRQEPMIIEASVVNILPGICTMVVTIALTVMTFRPRLPRGFAMMCMVIYFGCFMGQILLG